MSDKEVHSIHWLGEWRSLLWNADFMRLLAERLSLDGVRTVVDVGAGAGHWTRTLLPILPGDAIVHALDRESHWIERLTGLHPRIRPVQGRAEQLPFADESVDLVTTHTVLMHVADPPAVLAEIRRVLRPGGLLLTCEPCNRANTMVRDSVLSTWSLERELDRARLFVTVARGKLAENEGDNSIGDQLPRLLTAAGFVDQRAWLDDKCFWLTPPYDTETKRGFVALLRDRIAKDRAGYDRETSRRYFEAGGGEPARFDALWASAVTGYHRELAAALDAQTYAGPATGMLFAVAAVRPG